MIAEIRGEVWGKSESRGSWSLVVGAGGIGWKIYATDNAALRAEEGKSVRLFTHMAVRDDAMELYGFTEKSDLSLFNLFLSVSGIGPKKALAILNVAATATLKKAIRKNDLAYLTQVSGIGKKNAEKILLELKDKISAQDEDMDDSDFREESDAVEAIRALGYQAGEARNALREIGSEITGVSSRVKAALKYLGKK